MQEYLLENHQALSWEYAERPEKQLQGEVEALMRLAERAHTQPLTEQMYIPLEFERRNKRLEVTAKAKEEIAVQAQERFECERAEYQRKQAKREAYTKETGKKPRGRKPKAPTAGPQAKEQVNLTDQESRIMPNSSGGFEQTWNAQAGVDVDTHLIVEGHVTHHPNDKQ